jgi:hypothetical protein
MQAFAVAPLIERQLRGPVDAALSAGRRALIAARESVKVKVIQSRMGHASAMVTLDAYGHLFPDSDDRTRAAIDACLGAPADSVRTAGVSAQVRRVSGDYLEKA